MDFKSGKRTIGGLFSCKKQFVIPRFQREYTWGKIELNEFLDDILSRIKINDDGHLDTSEYFWGSLLLVGDLDDQKELGVNVVDGQQRITTMTIFLSVISKLFAKQKETGLSNALWEYVIGKDANTETYAVLKNETPKPFFQFIIQKLVEDKIEPKNTEEERILFANKFFKNNLSKTGIRKRLLRLDKKEVSERNYVDILKIVRDQLLRSFVICISTTDDEYANMIFEILNAKGKELASVDLIKNAIFEKLDSEVPADTAKELWLSIRNNLCGRNQRIEFATFYRHFWISHYGKVQDNKLYGDFLKKIPKNEESYLHFLHEMETASELYSIVLKPSLDVDFSNKKEYNFLITELNAINNTFGIVQVRPVILSLLYLEKYKSIMSYKMFRRTIVALSAFHLMYNAICSRRTSSLELPLNSFAHALHRATTKEDIISAMTEFKNALLLLLPAEDEFVDNFTQLKFSKSNISSNVLTKYIVAKWECILSESDVFPLDSSIEHIANESDDENTLLIGNLLLLEQRINSSIPGTATFEEKHSYYSSSKYASPEEFLSSYKELTSWDNDSIGTRGVAWGKQYYANLVNLVKSII